MVFKYVIVCASALLLQSACGQLVASGNSLVDNNVYIGNGLSNAGQVGSGLLNTGALSAGVANVGSVGAGLSNVGLVGSGLTNVGSVGAGFSNVGLVGSGLSNIGSVGAGFSNVGLAGSGLSNVGLVNSGFINTGLNNIGSVGSGSFGSGIISSGLNNINSLSGYNAVASGPLAVTSISPIGPSGLAVASENVLEGVLTVSGQLPFLSAVAFEGGLPTSGSGVATCGCGNGDVAIVSEGVPQGFRY